MAEAKETGNKQGGWRQYIKDCIAQGVLTAGQGLNMLRENLSPGRCGGTTEQIKDTLRGVNPQVKTQALEISRQLDAAVATKDPDKQATLDTVAGHLESLQKLALANPRLRPYLLAKTREALRGKPGERDPGLPQAQRENFFKRHPRLGATLYPLCLTLDLALVRQDRVRAKELLEDLNTRTQGGRGVLRELYGSTVTYAARALRREGFGDEESGLLGELHPTEPIPTVAMPWRQARPAVCLSDLAYYREKYGLPMIVGKGQAVENYDPKALDQNQLILVILEQLDRGVRNNEPFNLRIRGYLSDAMSELQNRVGAGDEKYKSLAGIVWPIIELQEVVYRTWKTEGAKGSKDLGAKKMVGAATRLGDQGIYNLMRDPHVMNAMMMIRGSVDDTAFETGAQRHGQGDVRGGTYGSVEKIGYYLRWISQLGTADSAEEVFKASYTLYVLHKAREYFDRQLYAAAQRAGLANPWSVLGGRFEESPDEKTRYIIDTIDTGLCPSAFHNRAMAAFVADNFESDKLGWANIGRLLVQLEGPPDRDPRWNLANNPGAYTLRDFLMATPDQQLAMAQAQYAFLQNLPAAERNRILERILTVNMYRAYYFNTREDTSQQYPTKGEGRTRWGWRKSLLDYQEVFVDSQGHVHNFVDIGSFDTAKWGNHLQGALFNVQWTDTGYAYDTQALIDTLCQTDPEHMGEHLEAFNKLRDAHGWRHLSEAPEVASGRLRLLGYERMRRILHHAERLSESYEANFFWENRRHGKERLPWSEQMNAALRQFYDMHRYIKEFEACGIYGKDWTNTTEADNRLTNEEKMAKILGKMERPEVWLAWLREIGLVDRMRTICGPVPPNWVVPPDWAAVGINDYYEYMAYNAIVSFAGYEVRELDGVRQIYIEQDYYGNPAPRVMFNLDSRWVGEFNLDPRHRGDGNYWMGLFGALPADPSLGSVEHARRAVMWRQVRECLVGRAELIRVSERYGELNEPTFSAALEMYGKDHEEMFIDMLFETYLQATYDKDPNNWRNNRWVENQIRLKKRWDTWALLRRQMKYTVGDLSTEDGGWFVHDQVAHNEQGQIVVDEKGIPAILEFTEGYDHVASMTLGSVFTPRPLETLMTPMIHDINSNDPRERAAARREANWRKHTGFGDAYEAKQLSWLPIYYYKYMMVNFLLARLVDVDYRYEGLINAGENWEAAHAYLDVADLEQQKEFWDLMKKVEDVNWCNEQLRRFGIVRQDGMDRIGEFRNRKKDLMVRDAQGKVPREETETDLLNLQKRVVEVLGGGVLGMIPGLRSGAERTAFAAGFAEGAGGALVAGNFLGWYATTYGGIAAIPIALVAGIVVGLQHIDKGIDNKTYDELAGGLAQILGGSIRIPGTRIEFALGMVGKRENARSAKAIDNDYQPVWDSALPMEDFVKMVDEYRKKLVPPNPFGR